MALLARFLSKSILILFILSCTFAENSDAMNLHFNEIEFSRKLGALFYKNKPFTGSVEYFDGTNLTRKENFKFGLLHGEVFVYHRNKSLKEYRMYNGGVKEGRHLKYWPNGNPLIEYNFKSGLAHGSSKSWFRNGALSTEFNYDMGKESGSQKAWLKNGKYRTNYVVRAGRRYGLIGLKPCFKVTNEDSIL